MPAHVLPSGWVRSPSSRRYASVSRVARQLLARDLHQAVEVDADRPRRRDVRILLAQRPAVELRGFANSGLPAAPSSSLMRSKSARRRNASPRTSSHAGGVVRAQLGGDAADRAHVGGHVLADLAVAARRAADQLAVLVDAPRPRRRRSSARTRSAGSRPRPLTTRSRQAVSSSSSNALSSDSSGSECSHGREQRRDRGAAHALGRRVRRQQLGVFLLERVQLAHQLVEVAVGRSRARPARSSSRCGARSARAARRRGVSPPPARPARRRACARVYHGRPRAADRRSAPARRSDREQRRDDQDDGDQHQQGSSRDRERQARGPSSRARRCARSAALHGARRAASPGRAAGGSPRPAAPTRPTTRRRRAARDLGGAVHAPARRPLLDAAQIAHQSGRHQHRRQRMPAGRRQPRGRRRSCPRRAGWRRTAACRWRARRRPPAAARRRRSTDRPRSS